MSGEHARNPGPYSRPWTSRATEAGEAVSHQRGEDQDTTEEKSDHDTIHPSTIDSEEDE